jgi:hypothetical protein
MYSKFLMGSAFAGMMRVVLEPNVASQIIQYTAKLVVPYLHLRSRLQNRAGLRKDTASPAAEGLAKLASMISDARTLFGLWGQSSPTFLKDMHAQYLQQEYSLSYNS